jgi:hypothetical protein
MRLTNRSQLPQFLVDLVSLPDDHPRYEPGRISVTQALRPAQALWLERQHWDELEEDVADRLYMMDGQMVHLLVQLHGERLARPGVSYEQRHETDLAGWTLTGQYDVLDNGTLTDIKRTSVWSAIDGLKPEWVAQTNGYAMLCRGAGIKVNKLQIMPWYRDWSKNKAGEDAYPSTAAETLPVPMWSDDETRAFFAERIALHQQAAAGDVTPCTAEERWEKPTVYALTKIGNTKATKLCASPDEAEMEALQRTPKGGDPAKWFDVIERTGESVRCRSYCAVSAFCSQRRAELASREGRAK